MSELREPMLQICCGMKGVGKTYTTLKEIANYLQTTKIKKGRKVLVFDINAPNERSYEKFLTVAPEQVGLLKTVRPRRVVGLKANGQPMTPKEKGETLKMILDNYRGGMLVLEDINTYMIGARKEGILGAITTNRHRDLDIIIHLQSLAKLDPTMWENCSCIRFHRQLDDIDRYADRIPNFEMMKLAQLIVNKQYDLGNQRYFVYVLNLDNKILGVNPAWFRIACAEYLNLYPSELQKLLRERDLTTGKPKFTELTAIDEFFRRRKHYIEEGK